MPCRTIGCGALWWPVLGLELVGMPLHRVQGERGTQWMCWVQGAPLLGCALGLRWGCGMVLGSHSAYSIELLGVDRSGLVCYLRACFLMRLRGCSGLWLGWCLRVWPLAYSFCGLPVLPWSGVGALGLLPWFSGYSIYTYPVLLGLVPVSLGSLPCGRSFIPVYPCGLYLIHSFH